MGTTLKGNESFPFRKGNESLPLHPQTTFEELQDSTETVLSSQDNLQANGSVGNNFLLCANFANIVVLLPLPQKVSVRL